MTGPAPSRRRRLWRWALGGVVVAVVAVVGALVAVVVSTRADQELALPDGPWPTTPPTPIEGGALELSETAVLQGGTRRAAAVLVPTDRRPDERLPAVVVLHGRAGSPQSILDGGAWASALVERRLVGVFPRGEGGAWNAAGCCRPATTLGVDDEAFLSALLDELARRDDIDPGRIYLVGDSNGGMMTYRLLCARADRVAGAASVMGTNVAGCEPDAAVSVLHVAATGDEVVPYEGGTTVASLAFAERSFPPVDDSLASIAAAAGCDPEPTEEEAPSVRRTRWQGCSEGAAVALDTIVGGAHQWPRGAPYDATTEVLDWFGLTPRG